MSGFITSDGLRLDYVEQGRGPAVLCIPGLTRDLHDFDELAATIGPNVRLIRLTLRGRNGSDFDPEWKHYNVAQEGRDVIEFMDFLGLDRAVLIGTSRGGLISMVLAATQAHRVAGVLLNDIGPVIEREGIDKIRTYIGRKPSAKNLAELVAGLRKDMEAAFPDLPDAKWEELARRWFDVSDQGVGLTYDPALRKAFLEQDDATPPDLWPLFDAMSGVKLALLRGENSDLLSAETAAQMQARRPDMLLAHVPNRGHIPFLDEPESLAIIHRLIKESQ